MTEKLPDVWTSRDYPVLVEVARRFDAGAQWVLVNDVAQALDMDPSTVTAAGKALHRRGLVDNSGSMAAEIETFDDISGEAYLLTGLHPSGDDALSSLVDALRQAADLEPDPAEKGRLRAAADGLLGISRNVAGSVITAWITHHSPGAT
jgi:DNA-binding transcriptional MocR family regulator